MSFISSDFFLFYLIVFILYWIVRDRRWQNLTLLIGNAFFYGWLVPWHIVLLFLSIGIDYFLALAMTRSKSHSVLLMRFGILLNICLLFLVKYYFFVYNIANSWLYQAGLTDFVFPANIILPLGLSFYILKKISYLIEVEKGTWQPAKDFISFAAYVSFFPQILSGPIDRPQKLLKQLETVRVWSSTYLYQAWPLILMGLFKKLVIANSLKVIVDQIFLRDDPSKMLLLLGGFAFTFQILADFSSYTDISRGLAFLLGLDTTENFNKPYLALTPGEFWNRWHISFSSWLRDYIFFPIRRMVVRYRLNEKLAIAIPPIITMLVSGIWHGVGWTFIVWGLYYGILIAAYQLLGIKTDWKPVGAVKHFFVWLVMFFFIVFGWLIFRSSSLPWLWNALIYSPYYQDSHELMAGLILLTMIGFYGLLLFVKEFIEHYWPERINIHALYYSGVTLLTVVFINSSTPDFLYFQF